MQNSLIRSSLKTFLMSIAAIVGLFVGLFLIALLFGILESADRTPTQHFVPEIEANADGVRKVLSKSAPVVLRLNIHGPIGVEALNAANTRQLLVESRENTLKGNRVKAILLHINTPGGTVTDADGIYRMLQTYKAQYNVPVYAYVDGMCASGGMYVASAADKIYASDVSLIGSVGVLLGPFINASNLIEKIGLSSLTLTAGKDKDMMNPLRPWKEGESKWLKETVDYFYETFIDIVAKARPNLSKEKLVNEYGAHVFPAVQAQEYGFIDVAGASYRDALTALLKEIDIEDDYYQVVALNQSAWAALFKSENSLFSGTVRHKLELPGNVIPEFENKYLYLYCP